VSGGPQRRRVYLARAADPGQHQHDGRQLQQPTISLAHRYLSPATLAHLLSFHNHRRLHSWLMEQSATSPPTARDTCLLRFELVGNLPLRNAAPLGHAHLQVRPLITGHTTGTGRSRGRPAIFIPSALCRLTCRDGVRLVSAARHSASVLLRIGDGSVLAFCIIINLHSPRNGSNTENTAK